MSYVLLYYYYYYYYYAYYYDKIYHTPGLLVGSRRGQNINTLTRSRY